MSARPLGWALRFVRLDHRGASGRGLGVPARDSHGRSCPSDRRRRLCAPRASHVGAGVTVGGATPDASRAAGAGAGPILFTTRRSADVRRSRGAGDAFRSSWTVGRIAPQGTEQVLRSVRPSPTRCPGHPMRQRPLHSAADLARSSCSPSSARSCFVAAVSMWSEWTLIDFLRRVARGRRRRSPSRRHRRAAAPDRHPPDRLASPGGGRVPELVPRRPQEPRLEQARAPDVHAGIGRLGVLHPDPESLSPLPGDGRGLEGILVSRGCLGVRAPGAMHRQGPSSESGGGSTSRHRSPARSRHEWCSRTAVSTRTWPPVGWGSPPTYSTCPPPSRRCCWCARSANSRRPPREHPIAKVFE